ncbi:hypothetical protein [Wenjunlia tyrosinilytica]|uniref:Uncharacterized protein n=1 Tax=Wenjunlia tyrosinilytica TaxID=1544741 RepID=A0A917ZBZ8_9ACTN|nr:hypothetical protein [Wenjunlia tyrosinilytica]GGO80033.1 hypothetical protein GCM10012280_00940 [Wenjunlia tyrosinilytica]
MDTARVTHLREILTGTGWLESAAAFAGSLRTSVARPPRPRGGLLLLGSEDYEPWHLAAHLDDEAVWSGLAGLAPTLVRCRVPDGAPEHLSFGLTRLEAAGRGETVLVVTPDPMGPELLERVHGARRTGATVLAVEAGDPELRALAHDALTVPAAPGPDPGPLLGPSWGPGGALPFDVMQHLVSAAAGERGPSSAAGRRARLLDRLHRLAEQLVTPPPTRW